MGTTQGLLGRWGFFLAFVPRGRHLTGIEGFVGQAARMLYTIIEFIYDLTLIVTVH
jgi:hypothetical protein